MIQQINNNTILVAGNGTLAVGSRSGTGAGMITFGEISRHPVGDCVVENRDDTVAILFSNVEGLDVIIKELQDIREGMV